MSVDRWLLRSERVLRGLLQFYPRDFREELGDDVVDTYRERCREALQRGGVLSLMGVWLRAAGDSLRNGLGERVRPGIAWRRSGDWGRDTQLVIRRLVRAPVFLVAVVGTLTVGLGAFAVVYTVVDRVLLAPLPYEDAGDLYYVWREYGWFDLDRGAVSGQDVAALKSAGGVIDDAVALNRQRVTLSSRATSDPKEISALSTSPGFFDIMRVQPVLGRGFSADEFGPGRPLVVVLDHDLWRTEFGGDASIIGQQVLLNGSHATVIGVTGPDFEFVVHGSLGAPHRIEAFTTFDVNMAETDGGGGSYAAVIRARPGATPEAVNAAVGAVGNVIDEQFLESRGLRLYAVDMMQDLVAPIRPAMVALGAAGVFLLLVLLVNLSTLLLARAAQREREFALAQALGANRLAVVRATLLEGGALGLLGGIGGVLVAVWGASLLAGMTPLDMPRRESIAVTVPIALMVIVTGSVLGLLAGALPAGWSERTRLDSLLGAASVRGSGRHAHLRRGMVVVQVALSLVLLSAGGLVVRSFDRLLDADPGFPPEGVLTMRIAVPLGMYADDVPALHDRIQSALSSVPGVTHSGATTALPLTASASQAGVSFPGAPGNIGDPDHDMPVVDRYWVRPGYLVALGARFVAGGDLDAAPPEGVQQAVIDRALAERFFPGRDALGAALVFGGQDLTVVGVVEHIRQYDVHSDGYPQVYVRNGTARLVSSVSWVVRTPRSPGSAFSEIRSALRATDPQLALVELRSMEEIIADAVREQQLSATLIGGFALGALLLAAMGIFGVVSGSVTRRRHELAVRLALGADHGRVMRMVLGEGARLVAVGLLLGVPGIWFAARFVRGVLVGISPFDPLTLATVGVCLGAVALLACYLPAHRVLGIAPAQSLRQE